MKRLLILTLALVLFASACLPKTPVPTPVTPTPNPDWGTTPLISAMQAGVKGNNNAEFIELYNPTNQPVDLQGWTLWYQLKDGSEPQQVYHWQAPFLLPPHGYLLLVREGEAAGTLADFTFTTALNLSYGGLQLQQPDGKPADALGWGAKAPAAFSEGAAAPAPGNGQALVRRPDEGQGNGRDTDDNQSDFMLATDFQPRNSAAPLTPAFAPGLQLRLQAPETVAPGEQFEYKLFLSNETESPLHNIQVVFAPPAGLETSTNGQASSEDGRFLWELPILEPGRRVEFSVQVQVPWRYFTIQATGAYATAADWDGYAFTAPARTEIAGGHVPIATARTLQDSEITVEGVATMYTGGLYAGGGNTKFYLQDETGGIQVQVFGGDGQLTVQIGDHVRVRGIIGNYRGAIQIVPTRVEDVEVLPTPYEAARITPAPVAIAAYDDEGLEGLLLQAEGEVVRVQENRYNYEIDLADEDKNVLTAYIDKMTGIRVDTVEIGQRLRITGVLEERDGQRKLYPRIQEDLQEVHAPGLRIQLEAPLNASAGSEIPLTLTIFNDYPEARENLTVTIPLPPGLQVTGIGEGGQESNGALSWKIPALEGNSASVSVQARLLIAPDATGPISLGGYSVRAEGDDAETIGLTRYLFLGDSLPIWAVQGSGDRSPYVNELVTTRGIVTAIFPDLDGFWIQTTSADESPFTSEGLFVQIPEGAVSIPVETGNEVRLTGTVREVYQQTTLVLASYKDMEILGTTEDLPTPVILDPPADEDAAQTYYEALEGMLVQVERALAVSPTNRYGETTVVLPKYNRTHLIRSEENGFAITFDDGKSSAYDYQEEMPWVIMPGDNVAGLTGPLAYTYGQYKIEPLAPPQIDPIPHELPVLPAAAADEFSIMTWNAENFFDPQPPHPSSPQPPNASEYTRWLRKAAATIAAAGNPTIIAFQEVENIGVLEDIAAQELLTGYDYQAFLIEGSDSRGIDVGYLVRGDIAEVLDVQQHNAPNGLTSRPPLVIRVRIGEGEVYVINNHFTSMSAGEALTEPRRTAQAEWVLEIVNQILAENPNARIAVVGDLNSFYDSPPLDVLRNGGLRHVFETLPLEERYTYIYHGEAQVLDHILVSDALWRDLRQVYILHTNADWPPPSEDDTSPRRKSDHDPAIAIFRR